MLADVVSNEAGDEVVAVVISWLKAVVHRHVGLGTGSYQVVRQELAILQETILRTLVNQNLQGRSTVALHELSCIMVLPGSSVWAQISSESLLSPGALDWVADR